MPEYLAPGVYVEEVSFRAKSIEGVSTTTTGFVGPARFGPVRLVPDVVTSVGEYERIYGDRQQMQFDGQGPTHNYMWHAARAFFEEGGKRLYVGRIFRPLDAEVNAANPGCAAGIITGLGGRRLTIRARFPGNGGNMRVRVTVRCSPNVLAQEIVDGLPRSAVRGVLEHDIILIDRAGSPPNDPQLAAAEGFFDTTTQRQSWRFRPATGNAVELTTLNANPIPLAGDRVHVLTITVTVFPPDPNLPTLVWDSLAIDRGHRLNGTPDSLEDFFSETPNSLGLARSLPVVITNTNATNGLAVLQTLFEAAGTLRDAVINQESSDVERSIDVLLTNGNDGQAPDPDTYEGLAPADGTFKTGLRALEDIDDISIIAAPGSTAGYNGNRAESTAIIGLLISHASRMRYRIAVIDSGDAQSVADVRQMRAQFDSTYAAFYYPWVTVVDPVTRQEIQLPPSGFVAGIYARNDINRGVYKAPANEVVNLATGFETFLNKSQQDVLNPLGVNCFRFFEGRGMRLWGGRTMSSDPEWKYVNLRRYFAYLEHSIDKGTQWAVFEPNGERLWANVRITIEDFLLNEWQNGALLGDKPEKAYFVRCDRSTMTQNDLDNGRLVCLIGVSPLRPAEYVIFRIGQWTADRK